MRKGREVVSRYHLCSRLKKPSTFIDSALSGFSDYPMVTEEAGFSLLQEPPHRAQPQFAPGPESKILYFSMIIYLIILNGFVNSFTPITYNF